jgi:hypothetical protein
LGRDFEQYEFTRADKNLDLFWGGESSPSPKLPIGADWSCRWTGQNHAALQRDLHHLRNRGRWRARLDRPQAHHRRLGPAWSLEYSADVKFEANKQYNIRVDYFESGGPPAAIGLYWESPSQKKEFVPQDRLFTRWPAASASWRRMKNREGQ